MNGLHVLTTPTEQAIAAATDQLIALARTMDADPPAARILIAAHCDLQQRLEAIRWHGYAAQVNRRSVRSAFLRRHKAHQQVVRP
jgi:hypothetical protein